MPACHSVGRQDLRMARHGRCAESSPTRLVGASSVPGCPGTGGRMEYITSRRFTLPDLANEFADSVWFNLWRIRLWPYRELVVGDILYWYESPSKCIVWRSRVTDVDRFFYDSKKAVRERLRARFGDFDTTQPYFVKAPEQGYCLAYEVTPLGRLRLPKPDALRFPQHGWLRVDNHIASRWLAQPGARGRNTG